MAQGAQLPPQSAPVSPPFLVPSLQLGSAQTPPLQSLLTQCRSWLHRSPKHAGQLPPQSTPVSSPSRRLFTQDASTQIREGPQAPEAHSLELAQDEPFLHLLPSTPFEQDGPAMQAPPAHV